MLETLYETAVSTADDEDFTDEFPAPGCRKITDILGHLMEMIKYVNIIIEKYFHILT